MRAFLRFPILVVLTLAVATAAAQDSTAEPDPFGGPRKAVVITLDGPVVEQANPLAFLGPGESTLRELTGTIDRAAKDDRVGALVVRTIRPMMGWAQAAELRDGILAFRETGKPVVALTDAAVLNDYLVVSAADRIVMTPVGGLGVYGLSADMYFFRDMLGKLGIEAHAVNTGRFKTAFEPFTHGEMSEGTRIQVQALLDSHENHIVSCIVGARGMTPDAARKALWNGPYSSAGAKEAGLVTDIAYLDAFLEEWLAAQNLEADEKYGAEPVAVAKTPSLFSLFSGLSAGGAAARRSTEGRIVVVGATGPIVDGRSDENPFAAQQVIASEDFLELIDEILDEGTPAAIVLRVDSPGGSAIASDRIWNRLGELQADGIPLVVSMGNVAASGGYYISMGADRIVAEPTTITGSIGVIGGRFVLGGTYGKIGVNKQSIRKGPNAGILDETRPWTADEEAIVVALLEEIYDVFTAKAAEGRGMTQDEVKELAGGRVWSGTDALANGLVDQLGGLSDAIAAAREIAGAPDAAVVSYPREKEFFELVEEMLSGQLSVAAPDPFMAVAERAVPARHVATVRTMTELLSGPEPRILAVHPMMFDIR